MADPISVVVRRGDTVESRHRVQAVVVRDGAVVDALGDPGLVTFLRSSAKPLQALPLARACPDLPSEELAIACASHLADENQLAAAQSLLARSGSTEEELACGADGTPPSRLRHNCSGKHAGMLLTCRERGWPKEGYHRADHPLQAALGAEVAEAAGLQPGELGTGVDGCGVVAWALPLAGMARAFAGLRARDGGEAVATAMCAHPALIRGERSPDTRLMRALTGWIAKGGAEGVMCAAAPDGTALALKVEDGAGRAVGPALAHVLLRLGERVPELADVPMRNSRDELVGAVVTDP